LIYEEHFHKLKYKESKDNIEVNNIYVMINSTWMGNSKGNSMDSMTLIKIYLSVD